MSMFAVSMATLVPEFESSPTFNGDARELLSQWVGLLLLLLYVFTGGVRGAVTPSVSPTEQKTGFYLNGYSSPNA